MKGLLPGYSVNTKGSINKGQQGDDNVFTFTAQKKEAQQDSERV